MAQRTKSGQSIPVDDDSERSSSESDGQGKPGKGKPSDKQQKRRSSKACDNCRKSKCRCVRQTGEDGQPRAVCDNCETVGIECTSLGATRKRGPPKGYIEAIESRLHRMEALLGGLLQSDDPRANQLLGELIGDEQAREVLAGDLKAAVNNHQNANVKAQNRKSWHKAEMDEPQGTFNPAAQATPGPIISHGFSPGLAHGGFAMAGASAAQTPRWFTDEELKLSGSPAMGEFGGALGFEPSGYRSGVAQSSSDGAPSPAVTSGGAIDIPGSLGRQATKPTVDTLSRSGQRRKLNNATASPALSTQPIGSAPAVLPTTGNYSLQMEGRALPANAVNHTGTASWNLSEDAELDPGADGEDGPMSELADVTGQLSLNENAEVRYHGRSSGLYLISKSKRFKNAFWSFPSAGVWPATDEKIIKSEKEILDLTGTTDALPDKATQEQLLNLYWTYVHPHFPILYKVSFLQQYRRGLSNPDSTERSTPAGGGKVPTVLLLAVFALASRYSDLEGQDGKYWNRGERFMTAAKKILFFDVGSSKLVSVQALLLMAYREIGTGAMSAAWLYMGMAIKIAQDLGLHRDSNRWYLPVQRFTHEEKQTRNRIWWGCLIMDRYTSSYIGRPPGIMERDYDTGFPSEDEPDEHEQWKPLAPDGQELPSPFPATKSLTLSCFNAGGALSVLINRVIINIYAIRIRVLGQSSQTLLSLLDQSLASWYLSLPTALQFSPAAKKVPPPHVLALHLQFYSALILLHRPFIPAQNTKASPTAVPSHSICTTSAHAIANIIATFKDKYSLRQCPPLLIFPLFSAAIICVYNAAFDDSLARPAKKNLAVLMDALKEMEVIWGAAIRQWELLHGMVDLRDVGDEPVQGSPTESSARGTKREAGEFASTSAAQPLSPSFPSAPLGRPVAPPAKPRRRSSSNAQAQPKAAASTTATPTIHEHAALGPSSYSSNGSPMMAGALPALAPAPVTQVPSSSSGQMELDPTSSAHAAYFGHMPGPASWDVLNGREFDLAEFQANHQGQTPIDYNTLINSINMTSSPDPTGGSAFGANAFSPPNAGGAGGSFLGGGFGYGVSGNMTEDWQQYIPQAFELNSLLGQHRDNHSHSANQSPAGSQQQGGAVEGSA